MARKPITTAQEAVLVTTDNLPVHVRTATLIPDPNGRGNHVYHPGSGEVFHVSPELFNAVCRMVGSDLSGQDTRAARLVTRRTQDEETAPDQTTE